MKFQRLNLVEAHRPGFSLNCFALSCQLRLTKGVEVAMFIYEHESQVFKVSLRSNGSVDVSKIASYFGGGGHVKAAGCDLAGSMYDVINNISEQIEKQLLGQDK